MNQGISGNRRRRKGEKGAGHPMAGMSLKKMARQMGIDMDELGEEGENMWNMLDDLATNDPQGYTKYIDQMMEEKAEFDAIPDEPHFFPEPGFVIKGVDAKTGHKSFVNICVHDAIQKPKNHAGREMTDDPRQPTDGMEIPMAVGAKRETHDHAGKLSLAVDVVVHPWVITRAENDKFFKISAADLALSCVKDEEGVNVKKPYKFIQSKYKGGLGKIGEKPVAFIVSHSDPEKKRNRNAKGDKVSEMQSAVVPARPGGSSSWPPPAASSSAGAGDAKKKQAKPALPIETMDDPKDLFAQLGDLSDVDGGIGRGSKGGGSGITELNVPQTAATAPSAKPGKKKAKGKTSSKPMISEVGVDDDMPELEVEDEVKARIEKIAASTSSAAAREPEQSAPPAPVGQKKKGKKKKKGKPAVKKGFLFSEATKKAKPLYEKGSEEGRGEHPWNKLMGRSKVIDMNDWTPQQQKAYQKTGKVPKGVPDRGAGHQDEPEKPAEKAGVRKSDFGDAEFEELMNMADPEYGLEKKRKDRENKEMDEELAKWGEMLQVSERHDAEREASMKAREKQMGGDGETGAELKATLDAELRAKKEAEEAKRASAKRPGTLDYSKFEEMDEDTELLTDDEKVERLREKREALQARLEAERRLKAEEEKRRKIKEAGKRPGTLDYSKFDIDDEDEVELVDGEEAETKRKAEDAKTQAKKANLAAAACVREEEKRFEEAKRAREAKKRAKKEAKRKAKAGSAGESEEERAKREAELAIAAMEAQAEELASKSEAEEKRQQAQAQEQEKERKEQQQQQQRQQQQRQEEEQKKLAEQAAKEKEQQEKKEAEEQEAEQANQQQKQQQQKQQKQVWSVDAGTPSTQAEEDEDEILEMGSDGTFDFDAKGLKEGEERPKAFDLSGKLGGGKKKKQAPAVADMGGPDAGAGGAPAKAPAAAPVAKVQKKKKKVDGLPIPEHGLKRVKGDVEGGSKYSVSIELPGLTSMQGVELDMSGKELRVRAKGYAELRVPFADMVDDNRVTAKFSKKKRALTVKVPIL